MTQLRRSIQDRAMGYWYHAIPPRHDAEKPVGLQSVSITLNDAQEQRPGTASKAGLKKDVATRYLSDLAWK
jgi:hypothetical protein